MSEETPPWEAETTGPAWKAELEAQIRKFDAFGMPFIVPILEPFILAAEERGRREAATARSYAARWAAEDEREPLGREALSFALGHLRDLLDPDKT